MKAPPPRDNQEVMQTTRQATVCSGIEGMTVALKGLPWAAVFFSEIEPFPCAVLKHHYPNIPNLGDMTAIKGANYANQIDVLAGGTPCQAFSLAGHRGGLQDPRGRLMLAFVGLARDARVPWLVWENVPGVLSQDRGHAFAVFLTLLTGHPIEPPTQGWKTFGLATPATPEDYGVCWRVLDAQYARVDGYPRALPQRRRRVWLVAHRGDWQGPARVLYESPESLGPCPPPRPMDAAEDSATGRRGPLSVPLPILSHRDLSAVKSRFEPISPTLTTCEPHAIALQGQPLRHLTPLECERLMGFPDGYTDIPLPSKRGARSLCEPSGRPPSVRAPKTARYKALGNSWAINCARWVLRRLDRELHPPC